MTDDDVVEYGLFWNEPELLVHNVDHLGLNGVVTVGREVLDTRTNGPPSFGHMVSREHLCER